MNVLSLFDGMSCGRIALVDMNIPIEKYYASEVDKHAIAQTMLNFPDTIQLGSVVDVDVSTLEHIDLLIGGSPCQSFSFAGKRKGMSTKCEIEITRLEQYLELKESGFEFEGQSFLFWEYMRILTDIRKYNPDVLFLLENVEMGVKWERVLSEAIGIYGVHINSALVSAQNRKRIYWFGQSRERYFHSEYYCYICNDKRIKYEKKNARVFRETSNKGDEEVLGYTQRGHSSMRNMPEGIFKNREEGVASDVFSRMPSIIKKEKRQEQKQGKTERIQKNVLPKEQGIIEGISEGIQKDGQRKRSHEESRFQFITEMQKKHEDTFKKGDRWNYSVKDSRYYINSKYEATMHCVCCGKELDYRPYNSVISWGNKRSYQSPSPLSKMQFEQARQNNGRVFDILKIGEQGLETLFGETLPDIPQPKDRGILLKDILETDVDEKYYLSDKMIKSLTTDKDLGNGVWKAMECKDEDEKSSTLTARYHKMGKSDTYVEVDKRLNPKANQDKASCFTAGGNHSDMDLICVSMVGRKTDENGTRKDYDPNIKAVQRLEPNLNGKTNCLTSVQKDNLVMQINPSKESGGKQPYQQNRIYDTEGISPALCANKADLLIKSGTLRTHKDGNGFREVQSGKGACVPARAREDGSGQNVAIIGNRIRRLTPTECSRLQTIPDWYRWECSATQQYRMLGNGWTVEIIKHIFSFL
jgi:site-specific DNA-cytosine methylase